MDSKYTSTGRFSGGDLATAALFTVDHFEEDYAVLECSTTHETIDLLRSELPKNLRPGDVLMCRNGEWSIDHAATEALKTEIFDLFERIKQKNL